MGEETQIEKLFRMMDKNADGVITKKVNKKGKVEADFVNFIFLLRVSRWNTLRHYKACSCNNNENLHILTIMELLLTHLPRNS